MDSPSDFAAHVKLAEDEAERVRRQVDLAHQQVDHAQRARCFGDDLLASLQRGHHPMYTFNQGFLRLKMEPSTLTAPCARSAAPTGVFGHGASAWT